MDADRCRLNSGSIRPRGAASPARGYLLRVCLCLCLSAALLPCVPGCDGSDEPTAAAKAEREEPLVGKPLIEEPPAEAATAAGARTDDFPAVDARFKPADPRLPPSGMPTPDDLPPVKVVEGYEPVGFARLAGYVYETGAAVAGAHTPPAAVRVEQTGTQGQTGDEQIPAEIKALDGTNITVQGYMVPIDFRKGGTNEFILVSVIPSCFFCQVPMPNQWVEVKMKGGERVPYPGDGLITVAGTLSVGAIYEGDYFKNLYRMEGHRVVTH